MNLTEILKAKGLDDEAIKSIQDEMKANKIYTASEENLDIRYGKFKTDHEGVTFFFNFSLLFNHLITSSCIGSKKLLIAR